MQRETKNNIKIVSLLLVVFIILYFLHITLGDRFEDLYGDSKEKGETNIIFMTDHVNKTLTVSEIYSDRPCHWPEVVITNGNASLPFGTIDVGDKITNCEGYLELKWNNTGIHIWSADFS
jgi:hypothetical protein